MKYLETPFIFIFLWGCLFLIPQLSYGQNTTLGREFYVGFMENNRIEPNRMDKASIIISAEENATGIIQYTNNSISFSIEAGEQFIYEFPQDGLDIIHRSSNAIENKGVYIQSNGTIAVHAFNFRERSADGTVVLPLSSIGKDYWVSAHYEEFSATAEPGSNINYESTLVIVAVEDDTEIELISSAPIPEPVPIPPGAPIYITLNRGESYQVKAKGDLTGSRVRVINSNEDDCKNVAVFGGNKMTAVGRDCDGTTGDHLFQQIYPTYSWGKEYVHIPLEGRTSGELVKVLASENNTQVFVNGVLQGNLQAGKFLTVSFDVGQVANITGNKPIAVNTFSKSQGCNVQNGPLASNGDPTMITLSPNSQLIKKTVFSALQVVGITRHYVNLLTKRESVDKTKLDGIRVGNQFQPVPGNPDFSYARIQISEGTHVLENEEGVIGYVYGSGFIESYGYSAGSSLNNLNFETEVSYEFDVEGDKVACLNQLGSWTILPRDSKFELFEWSFEGSEEILDGQTVDYLFTEPGSYKVKVLAMTGDRSCDKMEEAFFEVEVVEILGELTGPLTLCEADGPATYAFENAKFTENILWEVEGGEILKEHNQNVEIVWEGNGTGVLRATPISSEGCLGVTQELTIQITDAIKPRAPEQISELCKEPGSTIKYKVKDLFEGRAYEWFIEGGEFVSANNTREIEVQWGEVGTKGKIWFQESSIKNTACQGESEILEIEIFNSLEVEIDSMSSLLCAGSNNGFVNLLVSGGSGQYTYKWSHDENVNTDKLTGVGTGEYEVVVSDTNGCEIAITGIVIAESEPMRLIPESLSIQNATCQNMSDGIASLQISGGVGPYRVNLPEFAAEGDKITIGGLGKGNYEIDIYDANDCFISASFDVDAPAALEINFQIERNPCPGFGGGIVTALPTGGSGPLKVIWDYDLSENFTLSDIEAGDYSGIVLDQNGCEKNFETSLRPAIPQVRMPTGYNSQDGVFEGVFTCNATYELFIYNKWGQLIYFGDRGWDGMINGTAAPIGTYSYKLSYYFEGESGLVEKMEQGTFTLIK